MVKASKRLSLSSKKNKARKTREGLASTATRDDVNMLLMVAEIYNTSYDFEATEWFWGQYKETKNYEVRELNYLKGLHPNLNWQAY
jgi:hypothetical protein